MLLGASLFESKFLLPTHLAYGKKRKVKIPVWLRRMEEWYSFLLSYLLNHRYFTTIAFVMGFVAILGFGATALKFQLFPDPEFDLFFIKVEMPEGTPFEETAKATDELAAFVRTHVPEGNLTNVAAQIGHHDSGVLRVTEGKNQSWAILSFYLKPEDERISSSRTLIKELRKPLKALTQFKTISIEGAQEAPITRKPVELEIVGKQQRTI